MAEDGEDPLEAWMRATPAKMKMARSTRAPKMPQKSTRNWYIFGTAK